MGISPSTHTLMTTPRRLLTLTFLAALLPALALAQAVTLQFSGTANFVGTPLTGYFSVGNPYSFTLSYDPAAVGSYSGDTSRTFAALSASLTVQATGGTWTSAFVDPQIQITDGSSFDEIYIYAMGGHTNTSVGGQNLSMATFRLYSASPGPLSTFLSLPADITLAGWSTAPSSSGAFTYWDPGSAGYFMRFSLAEVQNLSAIPEPSTYAALAGLAALGFVAWRRRQAK